MFLMMQVDVTGGACCKAQQNCIFCMNCTVQIVIIQSLCFFLFYLIYFFLNKKKNKFNNHFQTTINGDMGSFFQPLNGSAMYQG